MHITKSGINSSFVLVALLSAMSLSTLFASESRCFVEQQEEIESIKLPELRQELRQRSELDQKARRAMMDKGGTVDFSKFGEVTRIDQENRETLDERRAEVGLESIAEYKKIMADAYRNQLESSAKDKKK